MTNHRNLSNALHRRASVIMPLGVNSSTRYWGPDHTLYLEKAKGAYLWDVDGNRYIDYRLGFGPIILGYAYEAVDAKVNEAIQKGLTAGLTNRLEIEVAEKIIAMCPAVEMVRLVNTGTEATMHAIRLARAYTGREKIIKFEGGYHGSHDYVLFSTYAPPETYGHWLSPISVPASSGIPKSLNDLIVTLPFNRPDVLEQTLRNVGHEVAAIITEPMLGNFGAVDPLPGFLNFIRSQCDAHGILLILDEVKSGFRLANGGAQEVYGIKPDLATYAKALGNGYPVAAYGGRRAVMEIIGRGVTQGGTYCGNGVGAAAANTTLEILRTQPILETIAQRGHKLKTGLQEIFQRAGIAVCLSQHTSIFSISLGAETIIDARDWAKTNRVLYKKFTYALWEQGVLIDDDPREPWCLCYSHSDADIHLTLSAVEAALETLR